jgi:hypothetical protein
MWNGSTILVESGLKLAGQGRTSQQNFSRRNERKKGEWLVSELEETSAPPPASRMRYYADILNPLFWSDEFNKVHRMFEWACTMVRVTGMKDTGWDSYVESTELLEDLTQLMGLDLPEDRFPKPANTQARLAVIAYSHMIEMSASYELLANLLRLRLGMKYSVEPLAHLNKLRDTNVNDMKRKKVVPASPIAKINEIDEMSKNAGIPEVGAALRGIYNNTIRNAVYHSDYAIHDDSLRLLSGFHYSKKEGCNTPLITFDELAEVTSEAFAFHSALLALWKRQRKLFIDFRGKILPYDEHYKGVIEYTFEGDSLDGFRVYWPNETVGVCAHNADGQSVAQNIQFEPDGSINFFVGLLASRPGSFSPCVESGSEPVYALVPGTERRPHWPEDFRPYAI